MPGNCGSRLIPQSQYSESFFEGIRADSEAAARVIVPMLNQLLSTPPRSVIDVGCGVGAFLAEFSRFGVSDFLGVDGSWVPVGSLSISPDRFRALNLEQPLQIGRRFDLVICLEVAEHLEKISSDSIVKSLVNLAPVVLFSAAVPGQTGVNHLNCQWPDYWARKFRGCTITSQSMRYGTALLRTQMSLHGTRKTHCCISSGHFFRLRGRYCRTGTPP